MSAELRSLIRDVAASQPDSATPRDVAHAVIDKDRDSLIDVHLFDLVEAYVTEVLSSDRRKAINSAAPSGAPSSTKMSRRRTWWARTLETRVAVGGGQWKRLGDCTASDLEACIADRLKMIAGLQNQIVNYESLLASLRKHKATTVGALTEGQVTL